MTYARFTVGLTALLVGLKLAGWSVGWGWVALLAWFTPAAVMLCVLGVGLAALTATEGDWR